ncbi:MAG: LysM peptidoglycan-binding domain-containing protein [Roseburia sp.]|nr:LysM peptidoglycan-binding domain-containing protein [Roseburia sp.]MCM1243370.1 LysM peptidoglycan-binding domain-containing protein [Roseburia sp.]
METTEIVIHKGEKDAKYQLYVEDYVISYLKNYGAEDNGSIFFYGKREQQNKRYRVYGAGKESGIACFDGYDLLDEITCRVVMDMPVFYRRESSGTYELSGFYIFYQDNEAMQSYMVERRKELEAREKIQNKMQNTPIHQGLPEIHRKAPAESKSAPREKNGLLGVQLTAVFVVLIAIVINSTNSFDKLEELNKAAVEVFFAIENQEALLEEDMSTGGRESAGAANTDMEESIEVEAQSEGTILRLEDLDARFEEENQAAKGEEGETEPVADNAAQDENGQGAAVGESVLSGQDTDAGESASSSQDTASGEDASSSKEVASIEETAPSRQAFARNFAEYYQIEKGDTLYTISIKIYGDTSKVKEICELNQIADPDNIKYGQKILLP